MERWFGSSGPLARFTHGKDMSTSVSGKCHCGAIAWHAELPPTIVLNCHCNMCRQLSGADYSSWLVFPASQFTLAMGEANISEYQATENFSKSFCATCGSTISCVNNEKFSEHIYVARGNIEDDFDLPTQLQVYIADKAAWAELNENIPVLDS